MTPTPEKCQKCGATLVGGLCRQCLLLAGMAKPVRPSGAGQTRSMPPETSIGRLFPELEKIRPIGRGGMGVVYQAHQPDVDREIALKLMPLEMIDAPEAEERFETEARAAARLDHPNIITLYEFGERGGSLFLKMKLIENGHSLAHALRDRAPWPAKEAVALLIKLARAVHHANQHGIIHRDIKPGNVLLDPEGEPFLSDFGLARIVEENTALTRNQTVLGTASYMAPEQADGNNSDLTTAADIYSLGAVVYEMLTGRPPFDGASTGEILRRVIEDDPTPPHDLNEAVDRDLSTICLKCLEKNPARRYGSAEALAEDLTLWQQGRPITARPISTAGRISKWARRRPAVAVLTTALTASVILGSALATWQAVRATRAERIAKEEAANALRAEKNARDEAATSQAVDDFIKNDLFGAASPEREPDRNLTVRTVLDRAAARIGDRFQEQPLVEAAIRMTLGSTYQTLGEYEKARVHAARAMELQQRVLGPEHRETLASRNNVANALYSQKQYAEAEAEHRAILKIQERVLGPEDPDTLKTRHNVANAQRARRQYAEADAEDRAVLKIRERVLGPENYRTLRTRAGLANSLLDQGQFAEAEAAYQAVLEIQERVLGHEHPDTLLTRFNLANSLFDRGQYSSAEVAYREVLKLRERVLGAEHPDTLTTRQCLGNSLFRQDKYQEAETENRAVLQSRERVLGPEHRDTLRSRTALANSLFHQDKLTLAEAERRAVLEIQERVIGPEDPDTLTTRNNLANSLFARRQYAEAEAENRAVLEVRERILGPEDPDTLTSLGNVARNLQAQDKLDEAREFARRAMEGRRRVSGAMHPATKSAEQLYESLGGKE